GPGTIVGEIAFFLGPPRSATLVVETDLTAYRLSRESLKAIRRSDPALSIAFHEFMARVLAERLIEADRLARHD
ncbi:MAG: cyclic nucleotide-binding domain-containing protein, partial [Syntrophobacteraceae bacterium]